MRGLLLALPLAVAALPSAAQAATTRLDAAGCGGPGGGVTANEFVVPAGVTSIAVAVQGGQGGGISGGGLAALVSGASP